MHLVLIFVYLSLLHLGTDGEQQKSPTAEELKKTYREFVDTQLHKFQNGNYSFQEGIYYRIFRPDQKLEDIDIHGKASHHFVHVLKNHANCLGLKTRVHETIVLECTDKKPTKPGCFNVFSPGTVPNNQIFFVPDQKVDNVCVKILNERCVGIMTPKNWTLPFECMRKLPQTVVTNTAIDVPNNGPPPRV